MVFYLHFKKSLYLKNHGNQARVGSRRINKNKTKLKDCGNSLLTGHNNNNHKEKTKKIKKRKNRKKTKK